MAPPTRKGRGRRNKKRSGPRGIMRMFARADPPAIDPNPWNKIILEYNFQLTQGQFGDITITNVSQFLTSQTRIDVLSGSYFLYKIQAIGAWELEGNPFEMSPCDLDTKSIDSTSQTFSALSTKIDNPGRNKWSHLSFRWPKDNRNNVLESKDYGNMVLVRFRASNYESSVALVRAYLHIKWRTSWEENPGRSIQPVPRDAVPVKGQRDAIPRSPNFTYRYRWDEHLDSETESEEEEELTNHMKGDATPVTAPKPAPKSRRE